MSDQLNENPLVRKNIYMSKLIATWYEEEAKKIGVSQTNLMVMALDNYITQRKAIDMGDILNQINIKLSETP